MGKPHMRMKLYLSSKIYRMVDQVHARRSINRWNPDQATPANIKARCQRQKYNEPYSDEARTEPSKGWEKIDWIRNIIVGQSTGVRMNMKMVNMKISELLRMQYKICPQSTITNLVNTKTIIIEYQCNQPPKDRKIHFVYKKKPSNIKANIGITSDGCSWTCQQQTMEKK